MNSIDDVVKWLALIIPLAFSPGAANITCANICSLYGKASVDQFIFGLMVASAVICPTIGFGCGLLFSQYPNQFLVLESFGVAYIFYLTYKLHHHQRAPNTMLEVGAKNYFKDGLLLQFFNAKFYTSQTVMYSQFLEAPDNIIYEVLMLMMMSLSMNLVVYKTWARFGLVLAMLLKSSRARAIQRWAFSISLLAVSLWLLAGNIMSWRLRLC